jgi:hypothetical protein
VALDPYTYDTTHLLTPPTVETLTTVNIETGPKFQKHWIGQTLREDVCELGGHQYVQDAEITDGNSFLDEVEVDLNMLCTLVLNEVSGEVDGADIVIVDRVLFDNGAWSSSRSC